MMSIDSKKRYESSDDFFALNGSSLMCLATDAAIEVCGRADQFGLIIAKIEGGIWWFPGFESRLDCIWDGIDPPASMDAVKKNNKEAIDFIREESDVHDVFILMVFHMDEVDDEPKIKILLW